LSFTDYSVLEKMPIADIRDAIYDDLDCNLSGEISTKVSVIPRRLTVFPRWAAQALLTIDPTVMVNSKAI
jgi:hypothetical protein